MEYPPELSYACEKFGNTVEILATLPGDVRSRLKKAYIEFWPVSEEQIPDDLKEDFRWIKAQLTKFPPVAKEGRVIATLERIKNSTGEKIAKRIVDLAAKLEGYCDQQAAER